MADITIETSGGGTEFKDGARVKLKATAPPGAFGFQWKLNEVPIPKANSDELNFAMGDGTAGEYVVDAKVAGKDITSNALTLTRAVGEEAPEFHRFFAMVSAAALVAVAVVLVIGLQYLASRILVGAFWSGLEGRLKVAIVLGLPTLVVGTVVVLIGVWMAVVEWRGRLKRPAFGMFRTNTVGAGDVKELIGAVGSLRGAALTLVVGAILMLGAAWVGQSAAGTALPDTVSRTAAPAAAPGGGGAQATPRPATAPPSSSPRPSST